MPSRKIAEMEIVMLNTFLVITAGGNAYGTTLPVI